MDPREILNTSEQAKKAACFMVFARFLGQCGAILENEIPQASTEFGHNGTSRGWTRFEGTRVEEPDQVITISCTSNIMLHSCQMRPLGRSNYSR